MNKSLVKATLLLCSSMTVMSGAAIAPALPQMKEIFIDAPSVDLLIRLALTIPALFIAVASPLAGVIADAFGRLRLLILSLSLLLFGIAGSLGFFLRDIYLILVSRALMGLGVAGLMTASTTLIGDYFTGHERTRFMGIQGGFMAAGGVVVLLLSGFLADISWNSPFLVYSIGIMLIPLAAFALWEPERGEQDQSGSHDHSPASIKAIPVVLIYLSAFYAMIAFYMVPVQIPFLLERIFGESQGMLTGIAIGSSTLTAAIISVNYRKIRQIFSFQMLYMISFLLFAVGFFIISMAETFVPVVTGLAIAGFGMGLQMPNATIWLLSLAPEKFRGRIIGGFTSAIFLGQFLSPIAIQPLFNAVESLSRTFFVVSLITLAVSGLWLWRGMKRET